MQFLCPKQTAQHRGRDTSNQNGWDSPSRPTTRVLSSCEGRRADTSAAAQGEAFDWLLGVFKFVPPRHRPWWFVSLHSTPSVSLDHQFLCTAYISDYWQIKWNFHTQKNILLSGVSSLDWFWTDMSGRCWRETLAANKVNYCCLEAVLEQHHSQQPPIKDQVTESEFDPGCIWQNLRIHHGHEAHHTPGRERNAGTGTFDLFRPCSKISLVYHRW